MKIEKLLSYLFAFLAIYYFVANFSIYKSFAVVAVWAILIGVTYVFVGSNFKQTSRRDPMLYFFAWAFTYVWGFLMNGDTIGFGYLTMLAYSVLFLSLSNDYQLKVTKIFVWGLSILCFCSIVEYAVFLLTGKGIVLQSVTRTTALQNTYFIQLIFNLIRLDDFALRFMGLSDEPGRMGTLCGMLIFLVRRMEMNKFPFYVFLVAGIISFSLAFYVLLLIFLISNIKMGFKKSVVMIGVLSVLMWIVYDRFTENIMDRINNEENIDNRTSDVFDSYFDDAVKSGQIWFGVGGEKMREITEFSESGNGGGKVFLLQYGFFSLLFIFVIYNFIYIKKTNGKWGYYDFMFLLAFWLSFYQRQTIYFPFTMIVFYAMPLTGRNVKTLITD